MSYQIKTDINGIKRDIEYNILCNLFKKNKNINVPLSSSVKVLTQELFNVDLEKTSLKSKILPTLVYDEDNQDKLMNIYKEVAEQVAQKLNLKFVVNPNMNNTQEQWLQDRHNYFVFSDLNINNSQNIEPNPDSKTIVLDTMPTIQRVSINGVPHSVLRKNIFTMVLETSDVCLIRDIDNVEKEIAIKFISNLQVNGGFFSQYHTVLALPLKEDSPLAVYTGRDMIFASEVKELNVENNVDNKVNGLHDKIQNLRDQNFQHEEITNSNKLG